MIFILNKIKNWPFESILSAKNLRLIWTTFWALRACEKNSAKRS